ncbi:MAG: DUF5667 domain-containing protein [bacterium]|nr:DUF5667 domain-containing protein [bacterium]
MIDFSQIKLTDKEKTEMRGNILRSVRNAEVPRPILQRANIFGLLILNFKPMMVGLLIALMVSVGTSFAAEGSLPGDLLYSVKTDVNERISEVLAFSTEAKAEVEADISERRLEEAAKLASENRFSDDARAAIETNFERHANKVEERVKELEGKGNGKAAADISAKFQVSLDAHTRILEKLDGRVIGEFLPKIKAKRKAAASLKAEIESKNEQSGAAGMASTTLKTDTKSENENNDGAGVDNGTDLRVKLRLGL